MKQLFARDLPVQLTIANMIGFALTFGAVPIIAREIGPVGRGETTAALAAFAILPTILGLGMPLELRRRSANGPYQGSLRAARDLALIAVVPAFSVGIGFALTVFTDVGDGLRILAIVGLALSAITVSWAMDTGVLVGLGRYRAVALIRMTHPLVTLLFIVGATLAGVLTPEIVLVASIGATCITGLVGFSLCRVSLRGERESRTMLIHTGARFAGSTIAEAASSRLDQVIVLPLIGAAAAGQYSIAASVALLPLALGHALAADRFREATAERDAVARRQLLGRAINETIAIALPACALFFAVAAPLVPIVFGEDFDAAVPILFALAPGSFCLVVGYVASMLLAAQGRGGVMTGIQVGGLILGVTLLFLLGPNWSAIGAAIASSVSYIAILIGQLIALRIQARDIIPSPSGLRRGLRSLWPS